MRSLARPCCRRAFGLLDLLAILTVLTVLLALFSPLLLFLRNTARDAACVANMQVQANALLEYSIEDPQRRLPPLMSDRSFIDAPKATDILNWYHGAVHFPLNNWADVLIRLNRTSADVYACPRDLEPTAGIADDMVRLSYGLNWYFYGDNIDGVGGSFRNDYGEAPSKAAGDVGDGGNNGLGQYGPRLNKVKSPDRTILLGDRDQASPTPAVSYSYWRYRLNMVRHGKVLNLAWSDGHIESSSYERIWGPLGGIYRPGLTISEHASRDFLVPRLALFEKVSKPTTLADGGQIGPFINRRPYSQNATVFAQDVPAGAWDGSAIWMPFWQPWEKQPLSW